VRDRRILYAVAFLRALATGLIGVLLALYLAARGFDPAEIGGVVTAGLLGAAAAALAVVRGGDRIGRRRCLVVLSLLAFAGGTALAFSTDVPAAAAAAFLGMVNGMGRDRGAALILDQAILPSTSSGAGRTMVFARYNVVQDAGHALGALLAGIPALTRSLLGWGEIPSLRGAVVFSAALALATAVLYSRLSGAAESPRPGESVSPGSRRVVFKISALFALDSVAGGFLTAALLSYFFFERFGASGAAIGVLFFSARVMNAASHLGAAWLASRIGLVRTMVWTHVPSSLLLATVAFAPNFPVAAVLFLLRESLVEMDVPTRQSFVMAIVPPSARTFAAGVTHLVRLGGWAVAPVFAGALMSGPSLAVPLFVGAGLKIAYDIALYFAFRGAKPVESEG